MLNDETLERFIHDFYGYGNFSGDYWFIGLEQGGGNSVEEVQLRLDTWQNNSGRALEDAASYHKAIGLGEFFDPQKTKLQSTWARLIRVLLGIQGKTLDETTVNQVKAYQRDKFLRQDGDTCSIELLPLPSPSMSKCIYGTHSSLETLSTRAHYRSAFAQHRAVAIKEKIELYCPKLVMFYGLHAEYVKWWQYIAGEDFTEVQISPEFNVSFAQSEQTTYVISRHPVAHGTTNEFWHKLGHKIAE